MSLSAIVFIMADFIDSESYVTDLYNVIEDEWDCDDMFDFYIIFENGTGKKTQQAKEQILYILSKLVAVRNKLIGLSPIVFNDIQNLFN